MRSKILILILFITPLLVKAQDNSTVKETVMMKMLSLKNALIGKDTVALSNLLADDLTYGHSSGVIQTKQELIHDIATGAQDYKVIDPSDMNIRLFDNTAIVTMKSHVNVVAAGKALDINMYVTFVWIKENKNWMLEARQAVKQ